MNRIWLFGLSFFLLLNLTVKAQYISEILEYQPAPGQLINTTAFGSPQAAESIIGNINGLVSLGACGGYIVVKMEEAVENDPQNPFGIDFTIFGNSMPNWSEAGAVEVMKDENNNGLADDQWYALAGSDYYFNSTQTDYQIQYFKPDEELSDILWVDEHQDSGFVFVNSIHQHSYYPNQEYFPDINQSNQSYAGMKIKGQLDFSNPGYIRSFERGFGFADNQPRGSAPYNIPDNPYTEDLENSGGDAFDISWAKNENGEAVYLDQIDFIRISTAMNNHGGSLGEISTEIAGIIDVIPNTSISGTTKCIIIEDIPHRLLLNSNTPLNGIYFESGIPNLSMPLSWTSSSENTATIQNHILKAQKTGLVSITATSIQNPQISKSIELHIIEPAGIELTVNNPYLQPTEEMDMSYIIQDNEGLEIANLQMEFEISDPEILQLNHSQQQIKITALEEGESWVKLSLVDFPEIRDSVLFHVGDHSQLTKVFVCIKSENQIIMPRQSVAVYPDQLDHYIEANSPVFHSQEISSENLAQAIISSFTAIGLNDEFRFKNDLDNHQVYLWKVPVKLGSSLEYIYGYGGRTESPYERCWIVKLNHENISRDFQEIPIQNNDEITIYHINNINESWTLKEFKSLSDSVQQKGDIRVILEEFEMQMYQNAQVYTLDQWSLANKSLLANGEVLWYNEFPVTTDEEGLAKFQLNELGDHIISADGEEILIHVNQATAIEEIAKPQIQMYPNPVTGKHLFLDIDASKIEEICIYNLSGQIVWSSINSLTQIPVSQLISGTYFLNIRTEKQVFNQRFIKR
jgi:hypothetical protein